MIKLFMLFFFLSTSVHAQISLEKILNTDEANRMTISWRCSSENFPGIIQLPGSEEIEIKVRNNGSIKIHPNIFNDKFQIKSLLQKLGLKKKVEIQKTNLSINYEDCLNDFYKKINESFLQKIKNCSSKKSNICNFNQAQFLENIQGQILDSTYSKKNVDSIKLPRFLIFNEENSLSPQQFTDELSNYCSGKDFDKKIILSNSFFKQVAAHSSLTTSQPSVECLDKYKLEFSNYGMQLQQDFCELSTSVCDFLKEQVLTKSLKVDSFKNSRIEAIAKQEDLYRQKFKKDWDSEFEGDFDKMLANSSGDRCQDFTGNLHNAANTKVALATTMTNLISKNMDKLFAKMDANCQKLFIRQYLEQNTFDNVIGDWSVKNHCKVNHTTFCQESRAVSADIEKNLEKMLSLSFGDFGKDYFKQQADSCGKGNTLNGLDDLLSSFKNFEEKMTCAPLKEGEGKVVSTWKYPTGISGKYSLKKISPKSTDAYVNINFKTEDNSPVSGKQMEERAKKCLKDISPYMKGPDGQSLNIIIVNPVEASKLDSNIRPPVNNVSVGKTNRANSGYYDSDQDCPTITHEVLHLFGLTDEYKEQWMGNYFDVETGKVISTTEGKAKEAEGKSKFVDSYNCRNVVDVSSIMKDQYDVFSKAVPKKVSCECQSNTCKDFMGGGSPELQKLFKNYGWDVIDSYYRNKFCSAKAKPSLTKEQYLLNPKQFDLISSDEAKISYQFKYASVDSEIKSVEMSCDCSKPLSYVEENDVATCKNIVSDISQKMNIDAPEDQRSCPPGTVTKGTTWGGDPKLIGQYNGTSFERFQSRVKPEMDSIIWPSQFERLIGGACPEKAELYSKCSQFAYKTSLDESACKVPEECKDTKKLLGIQR